MDRDAHQARVENALPAARAAVQEVVVPGAALR
jgi:hypothetical protein